MFFSRSIQAPQVAVGSAEAAGVCAFSETWAIFRVFFPVTLLFLAGCAGAMREPAPGPALPTLHLYDASKALASHPNDDRKALRIQVLFSSGIEEGLRMRLQSSLKSAREEKGLLSPWPATFVVINSEEERKDSGESFTHRLRFDSGTTSVKLHAFVLEASGPREINNVELSLMDRQELDDGGFDFLSSGQPLPLERRPPARLTDDARRSLGAFLDRLGMGSVRIYSSARADVLLRENGRLLSVGSTPLDLNMKAGIREFVLRRAGQPEQALSVRVADGEERSLLTSWSDDADPGSALIFTSPGGYRLALDGEVIGETPVARPGVLAGVYELEISQRTDSPAEYRVLSTDRLSIRSGQRSDRFYPMMYHFIPSGAALRSALEEGLWNYSAADSRFLFTDFDHPFLNEGAGFATVPIGASVLQLEALLPDASAGFGVYGETDRWMIEPGSKSIRLRVERQGQIEVYTLAHESGRQIYLFMELDREANTLTLSANGSTFYDGPFTAGQSFRLVSLGLPGGNRLPDEILLRSGEERGGLFFRMGRSLWYRSKSLSASPLRLKEEVSR